MSLKLPGSHFQSCLLEQAQRSVEEGGGRLWVHGVAEAGAATPARVAVEGELADYEKVGGCVEGGQVESARVVAENAKIGRLVDNIGGVFAVVVFVDADEDD